MFVLRVVLLSAALVTLLCFLWSSNIYTNLCNTLSCDHMHLLIFYAPLLPYQCAFFVSLVMQVRVLVVRIWRIVDHFSPWFFLMLASISFL